MPSDRGRLGKTPNLPGDASSDGGELGRFGDGFTSPTKVAQRPAHHHARSLVGQPGRSSSAMTAVFWCHFESELSRPLSKSVMNTATTRGKRG